MTEVTIGRARDRVTAIYALCEPDQTPRYVGKTVRHLHERHKQHICEARKRKRLPVHRWIAKRIEQRAELVIRLIECVPAGADWAEREKYWIKTYREAGHNLLNLTDGGEGLPGFTHSLERNARIASKLRTGAWFNCEFCSSKFWRKRNEINKGDCRFCSKPCYASSLRGVHRPVPAIATERGVKAAAEKRRSRTNCKRGHPLSGENLFITSAGSRGCKECRKLHKATYRGKANG